MALPSNLSSLSLLLLKSYRSKSTRPKEESRNTFAQIEVHCNILMLLIDAFRKKESKWKL